MGTSGLGALLVSEGLLSETDRRTIKRTCGTQGPAFARGILAMGLLDEDELAAFLAERTAWRLAAKELMSESKGDAWGAVDRPLLERLEVLPLRLEKRTLYVAMVDPLDSDTVAQLEFFSGYSVRPVIATLSQIRKGLKALFADYKPAASGLEEFLTNHVATASRRLRVIDGGGGKPAAPTRAAPPAKKEEVHSFADDELDEAPAPAAAASDDDALADLEYPDSVNKAEGPTESLSLTDESLDDGGDALEADADDPFATEEAAAPMAPDPVGDDAIDDGSDTPPAAGEQALGLEDGDLDALESSFEAELGGDLDGFGAPSAAVKAAAKPAAAPPFAASASAIDDLLSFEDGGGAAKAAAPAPAAADAMDALDELEGMGDAAAKTAGDDSVLDDLAGELAVDGGAEELGLGERDGTLTGEGDDLALGELDAAPVNDDALGLGGDDELALGDLDAAPASDDALGLGGDDELALGDLDAAPASDDALGLGGDDELALSDLDAAPASGDDELALGDLDKAPVSDDALGLGGDDELALGDLDAAPASDDALGLGGDDELALGDLDATPAADDGLGLGGDEDLALGDLDAAPASDDALGLGGDDELALGELDATPATPAELGLGADPDLGLDEADADSLAAMAFDGDDAPAAPSAAPANAVAAFEELGFEEDTGAEAPASAAVPAEMLAFDELGFESDADGEAPAATPEPADALSFDELGFEEDAAASPDFAAALGDDALAADEPSLDALADEIAATPLPPPPKARAAAQTPPPPVKRPAAAAPAATAGGAFSASTAALNRALLGLTLAADVGDGLRRVAPALVASGLTRGLLLELKGQTARPLAAWTNDSAVETDAKSLGRFLAPGLAPAAQRLFAGWSPLEESARGDTLKPFAAWKAGGHTLLATLAPIDAARGLVVVAAWSDAVKDDQLLKQLSADLLRKLAKKA